MNDENKLFSSKFAVPSARASYTGPSGRFANFDRKVLSFIVIALRPSFIRRPLKNCETKTLSLPKLQASKY